MKRIGIITLFGYHNYGNRLQNYATQIVLEKMGFSVETVKNIKIPVKKSFLKKILDNRKNFKKVIINKFFSKTNISLNSEREKNIFKFSKKYIHETDYTISLDNIPMDLGQKFDYFITGSDQVWHPSFSASSIEFLSFAPLEKRISFSASFGVSEIPDTKLNYYKEKLSGMASISVRESRGAEIVKELTGKDVDVLVDPTMLLSKEEWFEIIKGNYKLKKDYIFLYFLGEMTKDHKKWIEQVAKIYGLEIINILDMTDKDIYISDPGDFISLINNAKLVCTDSFHGSVFSIIMETNFIVFDRIQDNKATMGSRIDTLLEKFNLNARKWNENLNHNELMSMSFVSSVNILEIEKKKSLDFLKKSLI